MAVRHHRQAARQEPGGPLPVGPRSGRLAGRLRGPAHGERQTQGLFPYPPKQTRRERGRQVEMGRGGSPVAPRPRRGDHELTGVTHWLRNQPPTPDAPKNDDGDHVRRDRPDDKELPAVFTNTLAMEFKLIPAGKFMMGSPKEEIDHFQALVEGSTWAESCVTAEGPDGMKVEITRPFYMGATKVTVGQFRQFVTQKNYQAGDDRWQNPGWQQTDNHPVVWVSWNNAVDFCNWFSTKEGRKYACPRRPNGNIAAGQANPGLGIASTTTTTS